MQIKINGTEHEWSGEKIAYEDVVAMAYGPSTRALMSITYYWRGGSTSDTHREGTMRPNGPSVKVASGMIFNAYHTGNA